MSSPPPYRDNVMVRWGRHDAGHLTSDDVDPRVSFFQNMGESSNGRFRTGLSHKGLWFVSSDFHRFLFFHHRPITKWRRFHVGISATPILDMNLFGEAMAKLILRSGLKLRTSRTRHRISSFLVSPVIHLCMSCLLQCLKFGGCTTSSKVFN